MESTSKIVPALNILRRLPPSKVRQNVAAVATLRPEIQDEILQRVDQPLGSQIQVFFLISFRTRNGFQKRRIFLQIRV